MKVSEERRTLSLKRETQRAQLENRKKFDVDQPKNDQPLFDNSLLFDDSIRQRQKQEIEEQKQASITVWSWRVAMIFCCLSKRIHSIYMLRLFNDAPAIFLFWISVLFFTKHQWRLGSVFYSLGVGVKMNVLLFAPGLLLLFLQSSPTLHETIINLAICASIQILIGLPFLTTHPISYLQKAFEFDRVFFYKWTVNWKVSFICSQLS